MDETRLKELIERIEVLEKQNSKLRLENSELENSQQLEGSVLGEEPTTEADEASILRSMLSLQEDIEASLQDENKQLKEQLAAHQEVMQRWAPIVLGRDMEDTSTVFQWATAGAAKEHEAAAVQRQQQATHPTYSSSAATSATSTSTSFPENVPPAYSTAEMASLRSRYAPKSPGKGGRGAEITSPASRWARGAGKPVNRTDMPPPLSDRVIAELSATAGLGFARTGVHLPSPAAAENAAAPPGHGSGRSSGCSDGGVTTSPQPKSRRGKKTRGDNQQSSKSRIELESEVRRILLDSKSAQSGATDRMTATPFKV
jgi:hypothetical protein